MILYELLVTHSNKNVRTLAKKLIDTPYRLFSFKDIRGTIIVKNATIQYLSSKTYWGSQWSFKLKDNIYILNLLNGDFHMNGTTVKCYKCYKSGIVCPLFCFMDNRDLNKHDEWNVTPGRQQRISDLPGSPIEKAIAGLEKESDKYGN